MVRKRKLDIVEKLAISAMDSRYAEKKIGNGTLRLILFGNKVKAKISIYGWQIYNEEEFAMTEKAKRYFEAMMKKHELEEKEYVE